MPALLFHWNNLGFNNVPANPNPRNGVAGQSQLAIVANLIAYGARDYGNHGILFIFPNDTSIGVWARNVTAIYLGMEYSIYLCDLDDRLI
jgi:hypothetical protein